MTRTKNTRKHPVMFVDRKQLTMSPNATVYDSALESAIKDLSLTSRKREQLSDWKDAP